MKRFAVRVIVLAAFVSAATGCNLELTGNGEVNPTVLALAKTALQQTAAVETQAAGKDTPNAPPPDNAAALSPTATLTPTLTPTATSNKVLVTVSQNTNCRTGPDRIFDLVGIMKVGETAEAVGRNETKTYWVIRLPANTAKQCWLWYEWATVAGNGDALPVIPSPPTPTPGTELDASVGFAGIINCPAPKTIKLQIVNTGNVTWESYGFHARDRSTTTETSFTSSEFPGFPACGWASPSSLPPGATGFAIGSSPAGSAGHLVDISLFLYTGDGSGGSHVMRDLVITMT